MDTNSTGAEAGLLLNAPPSTKVALGIGPDPGAAEELPDWLGATAVGPGAGTGVGASCGAPEGVDEFHVSFS